MKSYKYKAKKGPDEIIEGVLSARTRDGAVDKINELGLIPVDIREDKETPAARKISDRMKPRRVAGRELLIFYKQSAKLIKAGVSLPQSLQLVSQEKEEGYFKAVLEAVYERVREGSPVSDALAAFPRIFSRFDIGMIQAGEAAGTLDEVFSKLAVYHQKQQELLSKVRSAIAYPAFIMAVGIMTVVFMLSFVVPRFSQFFADLDQDLPWITEALISVSRWIQNYGAVGLVFISVAGLVFLKALKNKPLRTSWDAMVISLPGFGNVMLKADVARLCRTLEMLLKSGIPVLQAARMSWPVLGNRALQEDIKRSQKIVEEGGTLSEGLRKSRHLPSFVCFFVGVGEESGRLDDAMGEVAEWYEQETAEAVRILTSLLEPAIILVVGLLLGLMIVAVLLPVFSVNAMIN